MFKAKWPAYLTCGEGPLLGSQLAIFSLCPHEQGLGALWGLSYKGTNPIPEGFSFMTNHLPKALSPNTLTPGIRFKHKNLRWGETTIWFGWSINLCVRVLSHVWLFVTPWTVTCQAPLSIDFSRQEYWSGLPFPPPRDLPDPGNNLCLLHWQMDSLSLSPPGAEIRRDETSGWVGPDPEVACKPSWRVWIFFQG